MAVKLNQHDLEFILKQIKIAEANSTAHAGAAAVPLTEVKIDAEGNYGATGTPAIAQPHLPYGLRTVDGSYNNLIPGRELWGASDQIMPRALQPNWNNEGDEGYVDINGPDGDLNNPADDVTNTDYGVHGSPNADPDGDGPLTAPPTNGGHSGHVIDSDPRIITNLVSDQTLKNPAAIMAALKYAGFEGTAAETLDAVQAIQTAYQTFVDQFSAIATAAADTVPNPMPPGAPIPADVLAAKQAAAAAALASAGYQTAKASLYASLAEEYGIEMDGNTILIPNVAPDEGLSAPFNGWMTFFGQFFDHGLDLIHKGDNGTIFVPLAADDPLRTHGPDGIAGSGDEVPPHLAFMALTRLKPEAGPGPNGILGDADDTMEAKNKTTPFVDQNQTYTSHPSHQVFLREYVMVDGKPMATGHLLDGQGGGLATWADVKAQAADLLGIQLTDEDILGVPLLRTDAYGEFIRNEDGFPQVVYNIGPDLIPNTDDDLTASGSPGAPLDLKTLNGGLGPVRTSHQFLDDIANSANPFGDGPAILQPDIDTEVDSEGNPLPPHPPGTNVYDNELLDRHFITGDGRGNENIGLTTVHHVFHAEHNRQVESVKKQLIEIASSGLTADIAFLNEWLLADVTSVPADLSTLQWDGERLFQVGRFSTEMQYQHLVFEEFGRKVQPNIDVFVFNTITDVNPAIFAEFAHTVYRFGHSMLTDHLKLLPLNAGGQPVDANGNVVSAANWGVDVGLIEAFLNPIIYDQNGGVSAEQAAGAIARGMTYVHGNAIDEFVTESLRNNLLGLPLDLAAINIARGRDAGVPSLNEAREQLYAASNSTWLKPYESWADFAANLKTPASIINFIAAYGMHPLILAADTLEEKRDAALELLGLANPTETVSATLTNAGFEAQSLETGQPDVITHPNGNYTMTVPTGWTLTGEGGLIDPMDFVINPSGIEGSNVAWLRNGGVLSQATGQTLVEGTNYRVTVDIGDRSDLDWPGGELRLVDSNSNVLASMSLGTPPEGGWSTVTLETGPISGAAIGAGLTIQIAHPGGNANQILIDDVRLDIIQEGEEIADRVDFLNGTGSWADRETGLNLVDLWIGGLAERVMPFGGMLGSTFNAIFELQMENLQEGDRFYYLSRTQGLNLLNELENNAFAKMIMANTDLVRPGPDGIRGTEDDIVTHHIGLDSFAKYDGVLEVSQAAQIAADGAWGANDPFLEALRAKVQRDDPNTVGADTNFLRFTGGEHMVMGGTEFADTIIGGDGDDGIWGGNGDDRIESGHGVDLVSGGAGDDIITDSGDTGDFLKGESGDDVMANSNGLDVMMGGDGKDVFLIGVDATEVFGGEGDDFMLGGLDHDFLLGNEGDDWMEGGDGFDVLNGDNSELFFNSTILGHDVLIAGENENDFDAESGDDIMVQGESVMRNEGMFGFDWAIYKGSGVAADADMRIPFFTTVADDILRDRFDQTEALSGWDHNDILRGDDRGQNEEIEVELQLHENHYLSQAGVNRIDGLRELLGLAEYTNTDPNVDLEKVVAWTAGNLLIGGDGGDLFEGRGGDDFIHGDAWLNVRIRIVGDGQANTAENEIATVDTLAHVFAAGEVDSNGDAIPAVWVGKSLSELLLTRVIKPNQMHIQREIKYDEDPSNDTDTAIFAGNRDWYEITHVGDRTYVARREMEEVDPQVSEGTDTLVGIERILFADGIYTIRETGNYDPTGRLTIEGLPAREDEPLTVNASAIRDLNNPDGTVDPASISFRWQIERNDGTGDYINIPGVSGNTFTPGDDHVGLRIRVLGTYHDAGGVIEVVMSHPTDVVLGVNDAPSGPVLISDMTPTEGQPLTVTAAFNDPDGITDAFEEGLLVYQWQYFDLGGWVDVPAAQGGNARTFTPGPEQVGKPLRVVIDYTDDGGTVQQVISAETQIVGNHIVSNAAIINGSEGDAEGGTTIGDDWVVAGDAANDISGGDGSDLIYGGGGDDELNGEGGADTLDGGLGNDAVNGGAGNDIIIYANGHGTDTIDGGADIDTLRIMGNSPLSDDTVTVSLAGGAISQINGATSVASIEAAELRLDQGTDTLVYDTTQAVSVNLLSGDATGFSFVRGVENITSGSGNDTLSGNSLANVLSGRSGNDILRGGFGNDDLRGGEGNDDLYGDQGDDLLEGGEGNDRIDGGQGRDTASYASAMAAVTVSLSGQHGRAKFEEQDTDGVIQSPTNVVGPAGLDRLIDIENLIGSAFGDTLTGDEEDNVIDGGAGADVMSGLEGSDTYVLDDAGDSVTEASGDGDDDTVTGAMTIDLTVGGLAGQEIENIVLTGTGNFAATGNEFDNDLTGNAGDNLLDGGTGDDTVLLTGSHEAHAFTLVGGNVIVTTASAGTDTLVSVEYAEIDGVSYNIEAGTNGDDAGLAGGAEADLVLGFDGNDTLNGNDGNDILKGGAGNDNLTGGAGNDILDGGASGGTGVTPGTLIDNFNGTASYSRNNGTANFTTDWTESGDGAVNSNSDTSGDIRNESNVLRFRAGTDNNDSIQRSFSLAGTAGATLTFGWSNVLLEDEEGVRVEAFNGTSWDVLDTLTGLEIFGFGIGNAGTFSSNLTAAHSAIRFVAVGNYGTGLLNNETFTIDNLEITPIPLPSGDVMAGGDGDDTYYVDGTSATNTDQVTEGIDAGIDTVVLTPTAGSYTLGANVENLVAQDGGDRTLTGNELDNQITGGTGNDTLNGAGGNDTLAGGVGNDTLNGGVGTADVAVFSGPAGNYAFSVGGAGLATVTDMVGTDGTDTLNGIERLQFGDSSSLAIVTGEGDITGTEASIIFGSAGDDTIIGSNFGDVIVGGAGNDTLNGYDIGTADDDVVPPQADDDVFIWRVGDGQDFINGGGEGAGGDVFQVVGNAEAETYRIYTEVEAVARGFALAGEEPEIFVTRQVAGGEEVVIAQMLEIEEIVINGAGVSGNGTAGGDTFEMYGDFSVTTSLRPDTITILGSEGDDTVNVTSLLSAHRIVFKTRGGNDTIIGTLRPQDVIELPDGRTAADYTVVNNPNGSVTLTSEGHTVTFFSSGGLPQVGSAPETDEDEQGSGDPIDTGNEEEDEELPPPPDEVDNGDPPTPPPASGSEFVVFIGTGINDAATGGTGDDTLIGHDGSDTLLGQAGNDQLVGGVGEDVLFGGAGDDVMVGDDGNDMLIGGAGSDMILGGSGDDTIMGEDGADLIFAGAGRDVINAGAGGDTIHAAVGDGDDVISGGDGSDTLDLSALTMAAVVDLGTSGVGTAQSSQSGSDTLQGIENVKGGAGNDTIYASTAANALEGGSGLDTFVFRSAAAANGDAIADFQPGDQIDLRPLYASLNLSQDVSAHLTPNATFNMAGQLNLRIDGNDTIIEGTVDGDGGIDFAIRVAGRTNLTAADFA